MESKTSDVEEKPPIFSNWKGIYTFLIVFELILIVFFIWITNHYSA